MKNHFTILGLACLFFLGGINVTSAQTYHPMPTGVAQWNIARCWYFYPPGWHDLYAVTMDGTDTVINQKVYKKLYHTTHHAPGTEFDSTYTHFLGGMREAGKQVFMISEYLCIDTIERLIYDFNDVEVGDYIYTQVLTNGFTDFIPHIVNGVGDVLIDGEHRRQLHLQDENGNFNEVWIEGIGSSLGLPYATYWQLTDNSYDLQCFYEGSELQYTNEHASYAFCQAPLPDGECAPFITSVDEHTPSVEIRLFPNPVLTTLHIETETAFESIDVYSILGVQVASHPFEEEVNLSSLVSGLYIVHFNSSSGNDVTRRIIKY